MQKELIYDKMNGFLAEGMASMLEGIEIEDEFAEGKECCLLYEGVYQAGRNLCERLGEDEDEDVETILNGMERITRLVSLKMLENYFTLKDYDVRCAATGEEALEKCRDRTDLILLDINMPDMDGLEVCRQIRNKVSCPILFLTARVEEQDRVNGLLSGGDDYILKPFSLKELEARIIAHLNREERRQRNTKYYSHNGMMIDYTAREVELEGETIELTKTEYAIIEFLSMHPGQVFDREQIYERICGCDAEGDSRSITELVRRIRKKLAEHTQKEYIETVWGVGYKWIN